MAYLLGVDTGGTYTDAVILDDATDAVLASAKALTFRPDLAVGVGAAIDAALADAAIDPAEVAMVSLSTTLATNALVEGQGGRIALVFIGFDPAELGRAGLTDALRGDPLIAFPRLPSPPSPALLPFSFAPFQTSVRCLPPPVTPFSISPPFSPPPSPPPLPSRPLIPPFLC